MPNVKIKQYPINPSLGTVVEVADGSVVDVTQISLTPGSMTMTEARLTPIRICLLKIRALSPFSVIFFSKQLERQR